MPLYEYACRACTHRFEVLQRMDAGSDGLLCPHCGHDELAKLFSTFAAAGGSGSEAAGFAGEGGCGEGFCGAGACGGPACGMPYD